MSIVDEIVELFVQRGGAAYFGEPVSQLEHALQTAWTGEQESAPNSLIATALLHDIGHLLHGMPEEIAVSGLHIRHEELGASWLACHFPATVVEPVRLHVAAKRYLCAVDLDYQTQLSPASQQSLELQGGPFSLAEAQAFIALPFAEEALRLRRWDERAKVAGAKTPNFEAYRPHLEKLAVNLCRR
jgi:[1-hydroxy-2-(trimethylamino)ethyl]phosphonate dioxygenase